MIRQVLRMGDPRLLARSQEINEFGTPELQALLQDMRDTMAHLNGAGLAAPQIGVGLRLVIFGVHANPRYAEPSALRSAISYGSLRPVRLDGRTNMIPRAEVERYRAEHLGQRGKRKYDPDALTEQQRQIEQNSGELRFKTARIEQLTYELARYKRLRYRGVDENGRAFEREASDFHARVVQHEVDHLDGILYPMRIRDFSKFGFNEALFPGEPLPQED